jgi:hypothetical protein
VPIRPRDGGFASATAPRDWATRAEAEAMAATFPASAAPFGVGLILGEYPDHDGLRLAGIDLDSCRDPATGSFTEWAECVLELFDTYAEVSPSRTGAKLFFVPEPGAVEALRNAGLLPPGGCGRSFKRPGPEHSEAIEIHLGGRFYTVTGDRLPSAPRDLRTIPTGRLRELLGGVGPRFAGARPVPAEPGAVGDGSRSGAAFRLARDIHARGGTYADFLTLGAAVPGVAEWLWEKGLTHGAREARRAWERAGSLVPRLAEAEPWPEPDMSLASAEAVPPPGWPADLFPGWWGEFLANAAAARGCPPDYVGIGVLAAVAARLGNARWGSPWPGWAEPPVLWCAAVGAPSSGKSSGLDEAADALAALEAEANLDWDERQREYRTKSREARETRDAWEADVRSAVKSGAAAPLEPEGAREPPPPARRRAFTSDPTPEKAALLAAQNPRGLLLFRDELSGWLGGMGRYSGAADAERAFWLAAHGGRRWVPDRIKDGTGGIVVPNLAYGIAGTIQPDRLATLLLSGDDDGLAARFLFAWPASRKPTRPTRPPPTGRLTAALARLECLPWESPEPVILPFSDEAADAIQEWREEAAAMAADAAGLFLSWLGKLPGAALRLAVVFEHLEWLASPDGTPPPQAVGADATARALGFLHEYAIPMARRVFGEAALPEAERDARRLARWLLRQVPVPEVVNAKALRRLPSGPGIPTAERMEAALGDMAAAGWCRPSPTRAGDLPGRNRKDWVINPRLRG